MLISWRGNFGYFDDYAEFWVIDKVELVAAHPSVLFHDYYLFNRVVSVLLVGRIGLKSRILLLELGVLGRGGKALIR